MTVTADGKPIEAEDGEGGTWVAGQSRHAAAADRREGADPAADGSQSEAVRKFLDYMSKTPEERYYEALLAEEGLTVEALEALPPEARAAVEARLQEKMRDKTVEQIAENLAQA